ncbi:hypothetical protein J3459_007497 [Metarhizium acridum]|uniref:uncharacterized protein n=1 Tax=Metarhizium acridum TaxID=92637 RepID=UPI001C6B2EF9|nr:hypothetical protein J3458_003375 [Metarhizium acridum]KAG8427134.1 hypothetical protein J3459_007497 [Metarhizium acridum]
MGITFNTPHPVALRASGHGAFDADGEAIRETGNNNAFQALSSYWQHYIGRTNIQLFVRTYLLGRSRHSPNQESQLQGRHNEPFQHKRNEMISY